MIMPNNWEQKSTRLLQLSGTTAKSSEIFNALILFSERKKIYKKSSEMKKMKR